MQLVGPADFIRVERVIVVDHVRGVRERALQVGVQAPTRTSARCLHMVDLAGGVGEVRGSSWHVVPGVGEQVSAVGERRT